MHHTSNTRKGRVRHCNKSENELGANWQNQIIKLKFGHWLHTGNSLRYGMSFIPFTFTESAGVASCM